MIEQKENPLLESCLNLETEAVELPSEGGNPNYPSFVTGAMGSIDEHRSVEMMLLSDDSFQIVFVSNGEKTSIRLSDKAIKLTLALWIRLRDANKITTDLPLNL